MRALVTGGAGFIGSHLVDRLLEDGHEVVVLDNFSTGTQENLEAARGAGGRLDVIEADVRDTGLVGIIEGIRPEVVHHLAAQADVRVSVADPVFDAEVNVLGTINVLEGARRSGARKVVFASSGGTIYGDPDPTLLPYDEQVPQHPISPYGVSKKVGGDYLHAYGALHGLEWVALALANVYGPRQDPHGEAGVVAIFAGLLLAGQPCRIFGTGEQTRDFVEVGDVVDAFARAGTRGSGLMNIGTGVETSVNLLYRSMAEASAVDLDPDHQPARPGELDRSSLDPGRAGRELDWTPRVDLRAGVARVLAWFGERSS